MSWRRLAALLAAGMAIVFIASAGTTFKPAVNTIFGAIHGNLTEAAARALLQKFQILSQPPTSGAPQPPVVITDREANSYLKFYGRRFLPAGVYHPVVHIEPGGVQGVAMVNFDQLSSGQAQNNPLGGGLLGMLFKGWQPVRAFGRITTTPGKYRLTIENVQIGDTQLNDWLVNWLLQTYVESKYKIDLNHSMNLPPGVTRLELANGKAIFYRVPASQ